MVNRNLKDKNVSVADANGKTWHTKSYLQIGRTAVDDNGTVLWLLYLI